MAGRVIVSGFGTRIARSVLVAIPLGGALAAALASTASGAAFAATASLSAPPQYLGDSGTTFTFTVKNTGTSNRIGAVEIQRPSYGWTVIECPAGPAGWTRTFTAASCRYTSAPSSGDDMAPGQTRTFQLRAKAAHGRTNRTGTWRAIVSKTHSYSPPSNLAAASPTAPGAMGSTVYTWQVTSAAVVGTPIFGTCPGGKIAHAGATRTVVVCAKNHAYSRLEPVEAFSSLGGTLIATPGEFGSVNVPARSAGLGVVDWVDTVLTSDVGTGKTVVAKVGSAANQTSPPTTLTDYVTTNTPPVAAGDSFNGTEDVGLSGNVLANDSDADGDGLTATVGDDVDHGDVTLAPDGSFTYTPDANYNGADSFTYTVSDGFGSSAPATVALTVAAVNDAPVNTIPGAQTVAEDGTLTLQSPANGISVADIDAGTSDVSVTLGATNGTVTASTLTGLTSVTGNGTSNLVLVGPLSAVNQALDGLAFTPAANHTGSASLSVTTSDLGNTGSGGALSDVDLVGITVTAVNDAPSFAKGADSTANEDSGAQSVSGWATSISAGPSDESGQAVDFLVTNDDNGLFAAQPAVAANGTLTYTPAANAFGSATVTVRLHDDGGGDDTSAPQTFTITVQPVNDAPSFDNAGNLPTVSEDAGAQSVPNWATNLSKGPANESGQTLSFGVTNDANALFSVQPAVSPAGTLTYTPAANANGTANITVTLNDDGGTANGGDDSSAPATVSVTITAVNDAPSFTKGADETVLEDAGAQSVSGWATSISPGPSDESGQTVGFTVTNDDNGLFSAQPAVASNGTLTYTPAADAFGSATVTVTATDSGGASSGSQTFTITVTPVNDEPSFTKGADQSVAEDSGAQSVPGWATAISTGPSNESAQTVSFGVTNDNTALFSSQPAVSADGTLTYTSASNAVGSATVSVTVSDSGGTAGGGDDTSAAQTFTITVTGVNDAPSFTKGADETVLEDAGAQSVSGWATSISPGPSDESAQTVGFTVTNDNNGLFSAQPAVASNGTLTYTPAADAFGSATVTVTATDSGGASSAGQTFTITVTPVNDAPSFTKGADQTVAQNAGAQSVPNWATAISAGPGETQTLDFTVTNDNTALFSAQPDVSPTGTLTYTPAGTTGSATVTLSLSDDGGTADGGDDTSGTQTFTITVNPPNATPTADATSASGNEDGGAITVTLTGHDADDDDLTFTVSSPSGGTLGSPAAPDCTTTANQCTSTVTFTPTADFFGTGSFTYKVNDGTVDSANANASVTVNAVNDAPAFTAGTGPTVGEDSGAYSGSIASGISAGPSNESSQTVTFEITNNTNAGLFSTGPAVAGDGTLTFTPAADANGSATITFRAKDDGGTGNGGVDTSGTQDFTITVTAVNDTPSFTKGADETVLEDAGAQSVSGWATAISKGPADESGQTLTFNVSNDNNGLFSAQPAVSPTGTLTYTPAANANGVATVTVTLSDDGGGADTSAAQTFTITVTAVNDAPVADADSYSGGIHGIRLRVGTTHADTHEVEVTGNVLEGDTDVDTPTENLTVTAGAITSAGCAAASPACAGNVTMASDGTFTYDPPAGHGATDTFTYQVNDNDTGDAGSPAQSHTNTVTVNYSGTRVWFVDDSAAPGGRGVSHAPLQSFAQLATGGNLNEEDGSNDVVFVYSGTYTTGIDLESGQKLLGQPQGLNVGGTQFVAAGGTKPAISSSTGHVVQLHSGANEVQDVSLGNSPAASYSLVAPAGVGAFTVADSDIVNTTGGALNVADGTPTVTLGTLSSSGSANNALRIADTEGGTVSSTTGTLGSTTGAVFLMNNANTTVTLGSAISDDTGSLVSVTGGSSDVTYNGTITDGEDGDGDGIAITGTSGDHDFTKSVLLSTGNSNAFSMTNSASGSLRMVPTANTNRLATTGGAALTVTDTPIHADDLLFERITAQDGSIDANTYGIHLSNTGASGGLTVAGTGAADSGGVITGKSTGIKLNNTAAPSFTRMKLTNHGDFAIKGDTVTGFTLANTVIDGSVGRNGDDANADEGAVSFDELLGSATISNSTIKEGWENDLRVKNDSGTLNRLTVTGTTFGGTGAEHGDSVQLEANSSATLNATVQSSTFTSARSDHVQATIQDNAAGDIQVLQNTLTNSHATSLGGGIVLSAAGSGDMTYTIDNNNLQGAKGSAIVTGKLFGTVPSNGTAVGTISNNVIGSSGVAGSGSLNGSGIDASLIAQGKHSVQILNNTIRQYRDNGILLNVGGAASSVTGVTHDGDMNYTITGNTIAVPASGGAFTGGGIHLNSGTNSGDIYDVCLNLNNNTVAGSAPAGPGSQDYVIRQRFDTVVRLPGYTGPEHNGSSTLNSGMTSYLTPRTNGAFTLFVSAQNTVAGGGGFYDTAGGVACATN